MFDWKQLSAHDLGPMGTYLIFGTGDDAIGGMITKPPQVAQPCWSFYIIVDGIEAAVERVRSGGGQVANGPMAVPGGDMIAQCLDPQGAFFSLVERKR
nr:VOC family protein [Marinicella sp. W31]MDC2876241.1 VOC family protein [Marinicella sp. W31]